MYFCLLLRGGAVKTQYFHMLSVAFVEVVAMLEKWVLRTSEPVSGK